MERERRNRKVTGVDYHGESSSSVEVGSREAIATPNQGSTVRTWLSFNPFLFASLALENKGSVARDHMANERTFLAWLRTSLSFITIGIGVTQLFRLESKNTRVSMFDTSIPLAAEPHTAIAEYGKLIGCLFIVLGIITLLFGVYRYFSVQFLLTKNQFPVTRWTLLLLIVVALSMLTSTFVMMLRSL